MKKCPECGEWEEDGNDECTNCGFELDISDLLPPEKPILIPRVLSIRQPWAWLCANDLKNIENRTWSTRIRGHFYIHASQAMTRDDYEACKLFLAGFNWGEEVIAKLPKAADLPRGGIVGVANLLDCVTHHESDWFTGPFGFVLGDQQPFPFTPLKGRLGFFSWNGNIDESKVIRVA